MATRKNDQIVFFSIFSDMSFQAQLNAFWKYKKNKFSETLVSIYNSGFLPYEI